MGANPGSAPDRIDGSSGWCVVAASTFCMAASPAVILISCFGVFLPVLHQAFGWEVPRIALGAAIISIAVVLLSPLQGWLIDRIGARRLVLLSVPVWGGGLLAMAALPPNIYLFYAACFILPFAAIGLWPLSFMKIVSGWFDRHLGLALGVTNVGASLSTIILPIVLGVIFIEFGWRMAYVALAMLVLIVLWPSTYLILRERTQKSDAESAISAAPMIGLEFQDVLRTRELWIMIAVFPLLGAISISILAYQSSILIDAGFSTKEAIGLQSVIGIGSTCARIGAGWLLDRVSVRIVGTLVFLTAAICCTLLGSSAVGNHAILAACLGGAVLGAEFDILAMGIRRYHGLRAFGRVYGIIFAVFQFGSALGGVIISVVKIKTGSYSPAMIGLAILAVCAAALMLTMKEYRFGAAARNP